MKKKIYNKNENEKKKNEVKIRHIRNVIANIPWIPNEFTIYSVLSGLSSSFIHISQCLNKLC